MSEMQSSIDSKKEVIKKMSEQSIIAEDNVKVEDFTPTLSSHSRAQISQSIVGAKKVKVTNFSPKC